MKLWLIDMHCPCQHSSAARMITHKVHINDLVVPARRHKYRLAFLSQSACSHTPQVTHILQDLDSAVIPLKGSDIEYHPLLALTSVSQAYA
jgi:hypothetical protein